MQKNRPAHLRALRSILPFGIVLAAVQLAGCGNGKPGVDEETSAKLVQPVARVELQAAPAAAPGSRSGEDIFKNVCSGCHAAGVAGAPKAGDKAAWGPRIAQGQDTLFKHALEGFTGKSGAMPAKGGAADLTDAEVARAVVYLANQAGAGFKEPADAAAK